MKKLDLSTPEGQRQAAHKCVRLCNIKSNHNKRMQAAKLQTRALIYRLENEDLNLYWYIGLEEALKSL
jgi:hypothetical protein